MTEKRLSKKASLTIVGILVLASAGVATAAATGATDSVLPMLHGKFSAYERGLSRHSAALAVHVGQFDGENKTPLAGATVDVYPLPKKGDPRPGPYDGPISGFQPRTAPPTDFAPLDREPIASEETDADGRAVFELRPGRYVVAVTYDDTASRHPVSVGKDTRAGVVFDADGNARWFVGHRSDVADRGEPVPLMIRVGGTDDESRYPIANATVKILKPVRGDDGEMSFETIAENKTGANGGVAFHLLPGAYYVDITTPDGLTGEEPLRLHEPSGLFVTFDADGNAHFREMHRGDHFDGKPPHRDAPRDHQQGPQPTNKPTPTREPTRPVP